MDIRHTQKHLWNTNFIQIFVIQNVTLQKLFFHNIEIYFRYQLYYVPIYINNNNAYLHYFQTIFHFYITFLRL